jgi:hypothetical protein
MIGPTNDAQRYRIIIRGECGPLLTSLMDNARIEPSHDGDTCVIASVRDDPEFWGLMELLRDFVLHVVSIQDLGLCSGRPTRSDAGWMAEVADLGPGH